ncbi:nitrate- and nitrite sensing domain-containing protein [Micromonospora sp. NBC_01655]|uniref:sensor histidine kinase n=1 Tax=Micromonospora sp. NBC_01655 TaxID=2975983 RepID=UPI00224E45C3|nr:nitrate- and nitrite sensing domain-containing protein [Micromonospora sp. NBC_01655]MCX4469741.1 nitrate- and nitrite sensing domain-containing protein [Micromonospora sp. NBC_01655]
MLLGRLRIRGKLALLVIIPLLSMVGLAVPVVLDRIATAQRAAATAENVRVASRVGTLVQGIQQERLLSVGLLLGRVTRTELIQASATVDDRVADLRAELGDQLPARVATALDGVRRLADLRTAVLAGRAAPAQIMETFGPVSMALIESLRLPWQVDTTTTIGQQVLALDALLRADEAIGACATLIVLVRATGDPKVSASYITCMATLNVDNNRFRSLVTPEQRQLALLDDAAVAARTSPTFLAHSVQDPVAAISMIPLDTLFPSVRSMITLGQFVEKKIIADVTTQVRAEQRRALVAAWLVGAAALAILLVVVLLSVAVARTVARPLTRLTHSADRVARAAEAELVRVADDESESVPPIRLDPVDARGRDEVGDLARAFERVQATAARLVERQVAGRRNVAQMFGHVGRRTQNLVGRQIALIDRLERQETDPTRLEHLYRLDHVSSRLRRNAGSLVVLSGSTGADGHVAPVPLADAVRLALGEIEDYTRVDVQVPPGVSAAPAIVGDLVLAAAELMENATVFSPPHTRVAVTAAPTEGGVRLSVVDRGIGMTEDRLAEENARLTRRERLDLVPTEVLGLFVVGRLARRHGWTVDLVPTAGGGVTARLEIPSALLVVPPADRAGATVARAAVPGRERRTTLARPGPVGPGRALAAVAASPRPTVVADPLDPTASPGLDHELLGRATRSMASGEPWNAFGAGAPAPTAGAAGPGPTGALAAGPPPVITPPTARVTPVVSGAAAPPAAPGAAGPHRDGAAVGGAGTAAPPLPVRTRGTSFPAGPLFGGPADRPAPATGPAPPAAGAPPARPAPPVAGSVGSVAGALRGGSGIRQRVPGASLPRTGPVAGPVDASTADPAAARALVEEFEAGVRRAGLRSPGDPAEAAEAPLLSRRVPGASLTVPPPRPRPVADPGDPAEVRDLINQFEAGVARALREIRPARRYEEGSKR